MNKTVLQVINIYLYNKKDKKGHQKNRSKINYSNKKIRSQKGSGKARISTKKTPIFIGGGRCFPSLGIKKFKKINKKMFYYSIFTSIKNYNIKNKIKYININTKNYFKYIKNISIINNNAKKIIIYKKINKKLFLEFLKYKNLIIIREDKINPTILNNNYNIIIINNALKWIKKTLKLV